ncbi:hypothetical protein EMCRGX_G019991 [Ephydatia muelleri]
MADSQTDTDYGTESEEFSEGEERPFPPTRASRPKIRTPRYPRPLSNLFRVSNKTPRGKFTRRVENSAYLSSLYNLSEEEIIEGANIVPSHSNPFTKLHSNDKCMQVWCSFNSRPEDEQEKALRPAAVVREEQDTERRFRRIDSRIRSLLVHNKHLPMELLSILEEELCYYFNMDPGMLVVIRQSNSYCRLLVHGICQYLGLHSTSEMCEGETCVFIECKGDKYETPEIGLADYLSR